MITKKNKIYSLISKFIGLNSSDSISKRIKTSE